MTEQKPAPLAIKCTSADCGNDLHCFKEHSKMKPEDRGKCRECGADLIDWPRVQKRDIQDVPHTFEALGRELIRHEFFHRAFDEKAVNHALRKGRIGLKEAARSRLVTCIGVAEPVRDGRQTPLQGNAIYYAQHATACCCRTCLAYWHGIPKGRELTADELDYCIALVNLYLDTRLPNLEDEPVHVPPMRHPKPKE